MKIKDVKRKGKRKKKTIAVSIRISPKTSEWIDLNNISPQAVFDKAIEELMTEK